MAELQLIVALMLPGVSPGRTCRPSRVVVPGKTDVHRDPWDLDHTRSG